MLSIIIPTLNESQTLGDTLAHSSAAAAGAPCEFIVSDCCSADRTPELVEGRAGVSVIRGSNHRAQALNRGAAVATGEILLFLHADTLLPLDFARFIDAALRDPDVVGGAFDFQFWDDPKRSPWDRYALKVVTMCNRVRFRWTRNFYGDQAIFVRRETFERIGGFPLVRLMEDIRFCRRMKHLGRTAILRPPVCTSPRRFITRGVARQFGIDLMLLAFETMGASPERLWSRYNRWNREAR